MEKYRYRPPWMENSMASSKANHRKKKSLWNWAPMRAFAKIRQQQFYCVFSIFVQTIDGLPSYMDGLRLVVQLERKSKRWQTMPSTVFQHIVEFDETLHIETTIFGRQKNMQDHSMKFLPKDYIVSVVAIDAEEHFLFNRHRIDLSRLLPAFVEGFWEPNKPMSSTASFKLGGKAEGATLVATFDFEVLNEELRRPTLFLDGNASARFGGTSLRRVSRAVKSLPNSPNPSPFVRRANHHFTSPCSSDADSTDSTYIGKFDLDSSAKETEEWSVYDYSSSDEERFQALKNDPLSLDSCMEAEIVTTSPGMGVKEVLGPLEDCSTQFHLANMECVEKVEVPLVHSLEIDALCHRINVGTLLSGHEPERNISLFSRGNREMGKLEVLDQNLHSGEVAADKFCINIKFVNSSPTASICVIETNDKVRDDARLNGKCFVGDKMLPPSCVKCKSLGSDGEFFLLEEDVKLFSEVNKTHLLVKGAEPFSLEKVDHIPAYQQNEGGACMDIQAQSDGGVQVACSLEDMGNENVRECLSHALLEGLDSSVSSSSNEIGVCIDVQAQLDDEVPAYHSYEDVGCENGLENLSGVAIEGLDLSASSPRIESGLCMYVQAQLDDRVPVACSWKDAGHENGLENLSDVSVERLDFSTSLPRIKSGVGMDVQAQSDDGAPVAHSCLDAGHENGLKNFSDVAVEGLDFSPLLPRSESGVCMDIQAQLDSGVPVAHPWEDVGHENGSENLSFVSVEGLVFSSSSPRSESGVCMDVRAHIDSGIPVAHSQEDVGPENGMDNLSDVFAEGAGLSASLPRNGSGDCMGVHAQLDGGVPVAYIWEDVGYKNDLESILDICFEESSLSASPPRNESGVCMDVQAQSDSRVLMAYSWEDMGNENGLENLSKQPVEGLGLSAMPPSNEDSDIFQFSDVEDDISFEASVVVEDFFDLLQREEHSTFSDPNSPVVGALGLDGKQFLVSKECWPSSLVREEGFNFASLKLGEPCPILQTSQETCGIPVNSFLKYDTKCEDELGLFSMIEAAELEMRKAAQTLRSKERAKMLEDAETNALMKEWGLSDKVFERPTQKLLLGSASEMEHLSDSTSVIVLKDGGCLKALVGGLMMQVSKPVVIPARATLSALDILSSMALRGLEDMTAQAFMKMPLEDLEGSSMHHALRGVGLKSYHPSSWKEPFRRLNVKEPPVVLSLSNRNSIGYKPFKLESLLEKVVSVDDLTQVALQTIEPLAIEGQKLQCGLFKKAPSSVSLKSLMMQNSSARVADDGLQKESLVDDGGQVDLPDTRPLLDMAISLDEWLLLFEHVKMAGDEGQGGRKATQREQSSKVEEIAGWPTWAHHCKSFTVAMRLQLRDPQRYYESVGASMMALVQVERLEEACVGSSSCEEESELFGRDRGLDQHLDTHSGVGLRIKGVHLAGVEQCDERRSACWGTTKQLQSGLRWLMANYKAINLRHMMSQASTPFEEATHVKRERVWSISACARRTWKEPEDNLCPCIRNPDITFVPEESL